MQLNLYRTVYGLSNKWESMHDQMVLKNKLLATSFNVWNTLSLTNRFVETSVVNYLVHRKIFNPIELALLTLFFQFQDVILHSFT